MRRIFGQDAVGTLPPPPSAAGAVDAYFDAGDPLEPREATQVSAWWLNLVQETLMHPITTAGLTESITELDQLTAAIRALALAWVIEEFVPGPPGRIKFRNGPMLQWGIAAIATGAGDYVVLQATFTTALLHVISSDAGANGWRTGWSRDGVSKASFRAWGYNQSNATAPMNYGYLAIGH